MPDMTSLNSLVSNFNQKALTSPHDALSAFSGMQWVLGQAFPGGLLYGIPEFFFEAGLMWIPSGVTERRRSTTRSRFESQLPSWSFLGWQGGVNFTPDCEFHAHPNRRAEIMIGISRPITTWYTMSHPVTSEKRQIKSNWHGYKIRGRNLAKELPEKSPLYPFGPDDGYPAPGSTMGYSEGIRVPKKPDLSTELPKGWGLFQFGPNAGYNAPGNTMGYSEVDGPREYGYRHDSDIERYDLVESHTYYRYPVPVQHEATQHTLPPQTQFLSCKTSRAFLHGISKIPTDNSFTISRLYLEGKNIGFVTQMPLEHKEICAKDTKPEDALFELVAISEGWACWDDEGDNDRKTKFWSRSDGKQCYHVICIGWEENIAYRRGIGCVLKETWEEVREEEQVDLILG